MLVANNLNEEKLTLETVLSPRMIQIIAEKIAISELFGPRLDLNAINSQREKLAVDKETSPKKTRKTNPKRVLKGKTKAASEDSNQNFWIANGDSAWELACNDDQLTGCQPKGGNYELTKRFLMTDWVEKKTFTRSEIEKALTLKYPEQSEYNSKATFRLCHRGWAFGIYYVDSGELAVKPIYRRVGRGIFENIFYAGA